MKAMLNRLPSRQALRLIRRIRRRHGPNHGDSLLLEAAEAALKCGNAKGAVAALEKFLLVAVETDSEERGLVLLALDHLRNSGLLYKIASLIVRLATMPLGHLLLKCTKSLLNYFQVKELEWKNSELQAALQNLRMSLD